jgi:hypothetical protein
MEGSIELYLALDIPERRNLSLNRKLSIFYFCRKYTLNC